MKTFLLWNHGSSRAAQGQSLLQELQAMNHVTVCEVNDEHAVEDPRWEELLREQHFDYYVAAGGDGTVTALVQALSTKDSVGPLAIIPLGTGNNVARSLSLPMEAHQAWELIPEAETTPITTLSVATDEGESLCLNLVSLGLSSEVLEALEDEEKEFWKSLAYIRGMLKVIDQLKTYSLDVGFDNGEIETVEIFNALFCNGPFAGNGFLVQPQASLSDRHIHCSLIEESSITNLSRIISNVALSKGVQGESITNRKATSVIIKSKDRIALSIDGELMHSKTVTICRSPITPLVITGPKKA